MTAAKNIGSRVDDLVESFLRKMTAAKNIGSRVDDLVESNVHDLLLLTVDMAHM
jgi:hypothetical protein